MEGTQGVTFHRASPCLQQEDTDVTHIRMGFPVTPSIRTLHGSGASPKNLNLTSVGTAVCPKFIY